LPFWQRQLHPKLSRVAPECPREETWVHEDSWETPLWKTLLPIAPALEQLSHTQLRSVTRCTTELEAIRVLRHKVSGDCCTAASCQKEEIHLLLVLVVVGPSIPRLHIRRDDNAAAGPQPQYTRSPLE